MILYDCCTLSSMFASQQKAFANWHFSRNPGGRNPTWQQTCSTWLAPLIRLKKHFALFPFAWYTSSQKTSEGADEQVCREADKLCWQAHLRFVVHKAHWYSCHLLSLFLPHYDYIFGYFDVVWHLDSQSICTEVHSSWLGLYWKLHTYIINHFYTRLYYYIKDVIVIVSFSGRSETSSCTAWTP